MTALTEEVDKLKPALEAEKSATRKAETEAEALRAKVQDLERAERLARVDLEQVSKRLEKIRSRAIQTALAGAGSKTPDKLITDDELVALLKKSADERADLLKKAQDLDAQQQKVADNGKRTTKLPDEPAGSKKK